MFMSRFLPPVDRAMRTLDRAFFRKVVPVTAARVLDSALVHTIKEKILKDLIPYERFNQRYDFNSKLDVETPLLILRPQVKYGDLSTASGPTQEYVKSKILELVPYDLRLEYGDWGYEEIMKAVLPEDVDPPSIDDFPRIGPLLHLDVPKPLREYRKLIAEVICDKEREVQTVFGEPDEVRGALEPGLANEVLAGPENYRVELSHQGSSFTFHLDQAGFRDVYFDTKLATERQRLVDTFGLGECVADVYSGVGALSVAAAKRGAIVFANERNDKVYQLLVENRKNNKVKKNLHVKSQAPARFVQQLVRKLFEKTVDYKPQKYSKLGVLIKNPLKKGDKNLPACVSHIVFSDPNQSLTHLECLRGIYTKRERLFANRGGSFWKIDFPFVHVYAYHKAPAEKKADAVNDLLKKIGKRIGHDLRQGYVQQAHFVKKGSKDNLYCITFKLPPPVAFDIREEELHQKQLEMVDLAASKEAAISKSDDGRPGRISVHRTYLPSRDPDINRFGPSGRSPSQVEGRGEEVLEPTPFPGAPTQIAPSATPPTGLPAHSPASITTPPRHLVYTPLASFQPRDAGSVATKQSQGAPTDRPPMGGGPSMTSNLGLIKTESELAKEFAKTYEVPQGLPPWKQKVHRKETKAAWMARQIRKQQEQAYLTQGSFNNPHRNDSEQRGPEYWGSNRGGRRFHSDNSPTQPGYGPYGYTECVAESVDRHSVSRLAAGSKDDGHANREETGPSRPPIRFHIAANKTPKGGPMIRWHQVDTHPKMFR